MSEIDRTDFEETLRRRVLRYAADNDRWFDADAITRAAAAPRGSVQGDRGSIFGRRHLARPLPAFLWLLASAALIVALGAIYVGGRAPVPPLSPTPHATAPITPVPSSLASPAAPTDPASIEGFIDSLRFAGQQFTPSDAPADASDWRDAFAKSMFANGKIDYVGYGVVTCPDRAIGAKCDGLGPNRARDNAIEIWLIGFARTSEGCLPWATFDGHTGAFINGSGAVCY